MNRVFLKFGVAAATISFLGLALIYLDGPGGWRARRAVGNAGDPRWRVLGFDGRPATEGEIYDVADVPSVRSVKMAGPKTLRFEFVPAIRAASWTAVDLADGRAVSTSANPDIVFARPGDLRVRLVPAGVTLLTPIEFKIHFWPGEAYRKAGLSWPDNFWLRETTVPFTTRTPRSAAEWAGFDPADPDLGEARTMMAGAYDPAAPALARAEQVFRFAMTRLEGADGTPSDAVQRATPLETCRLLFSGKGPGFCENKAVVYYLLANAAGVATRLIDMAGKFGPLKLTGHYYCESWVPEEASWAYVDPQSSIARARDAAGRLMTALDVKRAVERGAFDAAAMRVFDRASGEIADRPGAEMTAGLRDYFGGYPVLAFRSGYARNRNHPALRNFLFRPTLLYADFPLPRPDRVKSGLLAVFPVGLILIAIGAIPRRHLKR